MEKMSGSSSSETTAAKITPNAAQTNAFGDLGVGGGGGGGGLNNSSLPKYMPLIKPTLTGGGGGTNDILFGNTNTANSSKSNSFDTNESNHNLAMMGSAAVAPKPLGRAFVSPPSTSIKPSAATVLLNSTTGSHHQTVVLNNKNASFNTDSGGGGGGGGGSNAGSASNVAIMMKPIGNSAILTNSSNNNSNNSNSSSPANSTSAIVTSKSKTQQPNDFVNIGLDTIKINGAIPFKQLRNPFNKGNLFLDGLIDFF
jgi:hypothetical protein